MIWFFITLILVCYILNLLSQKYVLFNLIYKRNISKRLVEINEEFEIETVIENRKWLPVSFLQVCERFPKELKYKVEGNILETSIYTYHTTTMSIMPYQRVKRRFKVHFCSRGKYTLQDVEVIGGDFLAFKTSNKYFDFLQNIIVMPESFNINKGLVPYGDYNGDISVRRWIIEDPVLTVGLREYTGIEPQKTIHWPSSLRTGKLMVKSFDYTTESSALILLNAECSEPFWAKIEPDLIEKCISISRGVIEEFENQSIPYAFWSNGESSELDKNVTFIQGLGSSHFFSIMEALGAMCYGVNMEFVKGLSDILNKPGDFTTYVIITPRIFDDYVEYINLLNKRCMKLVVITLSITNLDKLDDGILSFIERRDKR